MKQEEERFNPYVNVGIVARMKIQDVGRLEQFIHDIVNAQLIYLEKTPKNVFLKILHTSKDRVGGDFE